MKARKTQMAGLIAIGVCCCLSLPVTPVMGASYVVQGVYQLNVPTGSRSWVVTLVAGREYEISMGLFTPGHATFTLSVEDPWLQHYTFVALDFWHSVTSDDLWASTFTAPLTGLYTFTLVSSGGTGQALQAYFTISDMGPLSNTHTHEDLPLADAHACNLSHAVWTYFVALEGNTTYFLDVARGDPCSTAVPAVVTAKVQALDGPEIPILGATPLPWEAPECNETQKMTWTGDWFGVAKGTTYNLVIEVAGLTSLEPVVVALTLSKEQAHGNSTPTDEPTSDDSNPVALEIGLDGVMAVGGPCAIALCFVGIAVIGKRRKHAVRGEVGVMKRDAPEEEW